MPGTPAAVLEEGHEMLKEYAEAEAKWADEHGVAAELGGTPCHASRHDPALSFGLWKTGHLGFSLTARPSHEIPSNAVHDCRSWKSIKWRSVTLYCFISVCRAQIRFHLGLCSEERAPLPDGSQEGVSDVFGDVHFVLPGEVIHIYQERAHYLAVVVPRVHTSADGMSGHVHDSTREVFRCFFSVARTEKCPSLSINPDNHALLVIGDTLRDILIPFFFLKNIQDTDI
jgi:hypothetical protein